MTLFHFSRLFPRLENYSANFKTFSITQESIQTIKMTAFFQTLVHLFIFDEKVKCRRISLELISWGQYSERNICCYLFISSITLKIFQRETMSYQNSVHNKTYCIFDLLKAVVVFIAKAP